MLDPVDFYAPLLSWLGDLVGQGFVAQSSLDRLRVTDSVDDALALATAR
jgi:predicted Rossmann-fold nucleotide-binding protein